VARVRYAALPPNLAPRGLCREAAAEYVGVSPGKFDEMVHDRRMPRPKRIDARNVWDIRELDVAFAALPVADPSSAIENPWDKP
jgi:predicted DNA-binding transcriptional regulator AlpA